MMNSNVIGFSLIAIGLCNVSRGWGVECFWIGLAVVLFGD